MQDVREEARRPKNVKYLLSWRAANGSTCSAEAHGLDISSSGVGVECPREIQVDAVVKLNASDGSVAGECFVAHCTRRGIKFHIGLEFSEKTRQHAPPVSRRNDPEPDFYDTLQISPKADMETVHRVFRIMAARFHPDNPQTGDPEEFLRLKKAYDTLSDPGKRAEYDGLRDTRDTDPMPIFELKDFVTGVEAESNRRLGVLSLLYNQRRMDPDHPSISLLDMEKRMGFPREYLSFTMWYLRAKDFVKAADNSDYVLTADGVDHVELHAGKSEILAKLLKPSNIRTSTPGKDSKPDPANRITQKYLGEPTIR
jgi:hypothetical protein